MLSLNPHIEETLEKYADGRQTANQTILALRQCGLSPQAANETLRRFNLDRAKPPQPLPPEEKRLALPLGYILETTSVTCNHCHENTRASRVCAIVRAGAASRITIQWPSDAPIYVDVEWKAIEISKQTSVCEACYLTAPRLPLPAPEPTTFRRGTTASVPRAEPKKPVFTETDLFNL